MTNLIRRPEAHYLFWLTQEHYIGADNRSRPSSLVGNECPVTNVALLRAAVGAFNEKNNTITKFSLLDMGVNW